MSIPANILGDKYETVRLIREGGMGKVYLVRHRHLDDLRVIKLMREQFAADSELRERFLREARTASRMKHPHIAPIHDFSIAEDGTACIVMEYIEGQSLIQLLREKGPPEIASSVEISCQVLDALGYLHAQGFIHRDISPDNIMLTRDHKGEPQIKLIDLGIAKRIDQEATRRLTRTGAFLGKVFYAAPEQFDHGELDQRSDIYSFAVVVYELLTGVCPIQGTTISQVIKAHLMDPPRDFRQTDPHGRVPESLRAVVLRALAKKPVDRFASAEDFADHLRRARENAETSLETAQTVAMADAPTRLMPPSPPPPAPETIASPTPGPRSAPKPSKSKQWLAAAGITALVVFFLLGTRFLLLDKEDPPTTIPSPSNEIAGVEPSPDSTQGASKIDQHEPSVQEPQTFSETPPAAPPQTAAQTATAVQTTIAPPTTKAPPPPRPSPPPPAAKSTLTIRPAPLAGAHVEIAGETYPLDRIVKLDLAAGEYHLAFRAPGREPVERTVELGANEDLTYQIPTVFLREPFKRGDLIREGETGVEPPRRIGNPPLGYPKEASEAHVGETVRVTVAVLVDENGKVIDSQIESSTFPSLGFNETALWSAGQATFEPATRNGIPGKMWTTMAFTFNPPVP